MSDVLSVEPKSSGFLVRFRGGSVRTLSVGADATLVHYTNDGVTYKQRGKTKYYDLKSNAITVLD